MAFCVNYWYFKLFGCFKMEESALESKCTANIHTSNRGDHFNLLIGQIVLLAMFTTQ